MRPLFEDLRTEEQKALAATVRRFVSAEVRPYLAASPGDEFPRALFARLCAMGLGGIPFPAEYGGGGADYATYALVLEELATAGGALAARGTVNRPLDQLARGAVVRKHRPRPSRKQEPSAHILH
jgi:alkylation response protein AidB-like acyl-CoA dehydrogenase